MKKFLPKTSANTQGFTLVELLVVIAILAILAVIGLATFSGIQRNARDARRREEVQSIAQALEANKTMNSTTYNTLLNTNFQAGLIPTDTTTAQYSVAWTTTAGAAAPAIPTAWATTSINPTAPSGTGAWPSTGTGQSVSTANPPATATAWTVCALLENGANPTVFCKSSQQ